MGATAVYLGGSYVAKGLTQGESGSARQKMMLTGAGQKFLAEHPDFAFTDEAPKTPPIPTLTAADAQQAASDAGNAMKASLKKNQGRAGTLLTGPMGLGTTAPANLQYRTLLGQ